MLKEWENNLETAHEMGMLNGHVTGVNENLFILDPLMEKGGLLKAVVTLM